MRLHRKSYDFYTGFECYLPDMKGLVMLLVMFFLGALLGNVLMLLMAMVTSSSFIANYGFLITYPVMFIPVMLYASRKSRMLEGFDFPSVPLDDYRYGRNFALSALVVSVATYVCGVAVDPLGMLLPDMPEILKQTIQRISNGPLWVSLLSVSVFAPFFEEWLCRGIILRGLLQKSRPWVAIVVSSLIFGFIHLNPWQAIPAFALGLLFGYVYWKTGSLKLTMLMHCVNNTLSVLYSRIDATREMDYFYQLFPDRALYMIFYAVSALLLVACIRFFRK